MSQGSQRREDHILDAASLQEVSTWATSQLRIRRDECRKLEAEYSYSRRLLQGRVDILSEELRRRSEGGEPGLEDLVRRLPAILADAPGTAGTQRLLDSDLPANAGKFRREIERLAGGLAQIDTLSVESLTGMVDRLSEAERTVSQRRRRAQQMMDGLNAELVRRYQTGEADPSALLAE